MEYHITYIPKITSGNVGESFCLKACPVTADDVVKTIGDKAVADVQASVLVFGHLCVPKDFNLVGYLKTVLKA